MGIEKGDRNGFPLGFDLGSHTAYGKGSVLSTSNATSSGYRLPIEVSRGEKGFRDKTAVKLGTNKLALPNSGPGGFERRRE